MTVRPILPIVKKSVLRQQCFDVSCQMNFTEIAVNETAFPSCHHSERFDAM